MPLFCAIKRDFVSFLMFPFLNHVQIISYAIFLVCFLKYPYSSNSTRSQGHQLQLLSPQLACSIVFSVLWQALSICFFAFFYFHSMVRWNGKLQEMIRAPATTAITTTFMFHSFSVLWQGPRVCFFAFFYFHYVVRWDGKLHEMTSSFFLVN